MFHFAIKATCLSGIALAVLASSLWAQTESAPAPRSLPPPNDWGKCEVDNSGFPHCVPTIPARPPHTINEMKKVVENVSTHDARFEVLVGQGLTLTLAKNITVADKVKPSIAVGDPSVVDFIITGPKQIRLIGQRIGWTDLTITTGDGEVYCVEVQVVADLQVLRAQIRTVFPSAQVKIAQMRDHVVVEGQTRDSVEASRIIETIRAYLVSIQALQLRSVTGQNIAPRPTGRPENGASSGTTAPPLQQILPEQGIVAASTTQAEPRIINLLKVVGPQQVLLKVRIAELSRTALREIGADFLAVDPRNGAIVGTKLGDGISGTANASGAGITGTATSTITATDTVFGIFEGADFEFTLRALRRNGVFKMLAEPNLVTLNGHPANFLSGGQFPVPVAQGSSGGTTIAVQFQSFGVQLGFVPYVLDGDLIRLSVDPEVSTIDRALGTTLVPGGSPIPGLLTRRSHATVEMRQGQTLAIAGLMQLDINGTTSRIPILGDLPVIGPFFSHNLNNREEKELVVLVTPYLVEATEGKTPLPGDDVGSPTDLEFYVLNRLESRSGVDDRSTLGWDDPMHLRQVMKLEQKYVTGPSGYPGPDFVNPEIVHEESSWTWNGKGRLWPQFFSRSDP